MLVWRWVRRHAAVPILVLSIVVLALSWSSVTASKEKGTFELVDLQGDRSAIGDVSIGGVLGDKAHYTVFSIDRGQVRTSTLLKTAPQADINRRIPGFGMQIGEWRYEVYSGPPYEIRRYNGKSGSTVRVHPRMTTHNAYTNTIEYGIANIGDRVFFVVPTTKDYTGTSALYELNYASANVDNHYLGDSREIASFSLDGNAQAAEGSSSSIQVFGLEAVGDTLVLVLEEDGNLIFRGYDSKDGTPTGEVTIEDYVSESESLNSAYRAFVDEDERVLNVRFEAQPVPTVFSIGATEEGLKLIARTDLNRMEGMVDRDYYFPSTMVISYRNGKLYVAKTVTEIDEESGYTYRSQWPIRFYIEAYEKGTLVYRGELLTDANEDKIRLLSPMLQENSFSLDELRTFGGLRIGIPR